MCPGNDPSDRGQEPRANPPTMRTIARAAGVSSTTVSMALRNHPAIAIETRVRLQRIAREMGYVPDPQLAKLMYHLQQRQKPRFLATIAALSTWPRDRMPPYATTLYTGVERAAHQFGYGIEVFQIDAARGLNRRLQRVLGSRGVEGIILLPMNGPVDLETALDWPAFSVVAATCGVLRPHFHRVAPDQFSNALTLCRHLTEQGRRRIGLVLDRRDDVIVGHRFAAAITWQNSIGGQTPVAPFIYSGQIDTTIREWFTRYRPDAIVAAGSPEVRAIADTLALPVCGGPVWFAVEDRLPTDRFAGIDQRPAEVGAVALHTLHLLLQRSERGVPETPNLTTVMGRWLPAAR